MSVENEPIIPVQVRYVEVQSATVLRNEKIPSRPLRKTQNSQPKKNGQVTLVQNGVCQSPLSAENIEVSHSSPVTPGSPTNPMIPNKFQFDPNLTYAEKVAHEMIVTEKIYLDNLKQIIDGFLGPVVKDPDLDVSQKNIDDLFINVEEIYQFNWVLLQDMEKCNYDPVKLAECFVLKQIGFNVYTRYCTNYPRSMEVLLDWNQREDTANFIKKQQESLGHTLPLCSFLLKPVQRILKYHLLLGNIAKHFKQSEDEEGYEIIQKALSAMTNVAKHINDMKRKHEDAVHLQEIQSVLLDFEGPNLNSFGSIVLEDTFRLHGTKTGRYLFLFEKALLITKRRSDGTFSWKATVMYSNMMLADSVFREPLTFQVIPFDDRKICHTFVARDLETKHVWLLELKRRLLDSYAAAVPMKAKQIILGNGREDNEKENAEPDSIRKSTTRKGANQQRQLSKDNFSQTTKSSKSADSERRKYKDTDESLEEKTKTSIDSFKSPLRRKLRVFKKRKFSSKDLGKSSKRVSWSSDDNNDESYTNKERLNIKKKTQNDKERKVSADSEPYDVGDVKQNDSDNKYDEKNDSEVSISSLLRDGETMVSVAGEEDNHLSGHVKPRASREDISPSKKRKLARKKRQKCKSMPAGQFPVIHEDGEFLTIDKNEPTLTRTQSLSRLYEKFLETQLIDTPSSIKELQKYGLVNVRESNRKSKRLGSYDEGLASEELIHRSSDVGDVIPTQGDDVRNETDQSVHHTMKRVSMAFSDISPAFSSEKSPSSSIEDITTEDVTEDLTTGDLTTEDLTTGDISPDEYAAGDLTPEDSNADDLSPEDDTTSDLTTEEAATGDLSLDERGTGGLVPDKMTGDVKSNVSRNENENEYKEQDENTILKPEQNGVVKDWNGNDTTENIYKEDSIYEEQSNQDRLSNVHSEASSYVDTLSDESCDDEYDQSWASNISSSYQRVFSLKRSYSEENLVSKYPLDDESSEDHSPNMTSKSCTHFHHTPVMRSKSADCSKKSQRVAKPLTFSVTPRKKIVIKDSLWETIKEDGETNHHEIFIANDVHALRRRRKRKSGHKKSKKNRTHSGDGRIGKHTVRTCAVLNMADHRKTKTDKAEKTNTANSTKIQDETIKAAKCGKEKITEYNCDSSSSKKPEEIGDGNKTIQSNSEENLKISNENMISNSQEKTDHTTDNVASNIVNNREESDEPVVTNIAVALKKKSHKPGREKSLVRVDKNVSEVPATINYLCIETFPSDESPKTEEGSESSPCDLKRTNRRSASKVVRLSKYFNNVTTEYSKDSSKYDMYKQAESLRKGSSIKKRVEELSKHDMHKGKSRKYSEEKLIVDEELDSLQNIQDRIRRSTSDENQAIVKSRIELTSSLNQDIPNVQQLKSKIEEVDSSLKENDKKSDTNWASKKGSTSLRIKDRIQELGQNPDKKPDKNVDEDLRTCKRLKERIERLQKGTKRTGVDSERDITISDENDTNLSPRQNEELRTVVIKRGWVQQFIQRIETGS